MNKQLADKVIDEYIEFKENIFSKIEIEEREMVELFKIYLEAKK